jgi:hypothetical protein
VHAASIINNAAAAIAHSAVDFVDAVYDAASAVTIVGIILFVVFNNMVFHFSLRW